MNKGELIKAVVKNKPERITAGDVEQMVNATLEEIKNALAKGKDVKITGFGSFKVKERKARTGRNPRTGAEVAIPAKKVVKFKPGKELAESVE
jgi:integration host factor beta subunit